MQTRGDAVQRDRQILLRHGVLHSGEPPRERLQYADGHALSGAAVACRRIATALRDQFVAPDGPFEEAARPERVRVAPQRLVVVLAVHVEHHQAPFGHPCAPPEQVAGREAAEERHERVEAAHLVRERRPERHVTLRERRPVLRPAVQGVRGEGDEPGEGGGRAQHVEQFDGGRLRVQRLPARVRVRADPLQHRAGGRGDLSGTDVADQARQPLLLAAAGTPGPQMARSRGGEAVHHRGHVPRGRPRLGVVQGHARPAVDAAGEHGGRLVEQQDRRAAAPLRYGLVPGVGDVLGESRHGGGLQQRQEQFLAGTVGRAVEGVHGLVAEEGAEDRLGDGAVPVHVPFVVEEADRLRSAQGEGGAAHDPGADHGAGRVAHPVGEPGVPLGEERQGAVDQGAAEYVHGGRVPAGPARTPRATPPRRCRRCHSP